MLKIRKHVLWLTLIILLTGGCAPSAENAEDSAAANHNATVNMTTANRAASDQATSGAEDRPEIAQEHSSEELAVVEEATDDAHQAETNANQEGSADSEAMERKIIREQYFRQQVQDLSQVLNELERSVERMTGAYIETMDRWESEDHNRTEQHAHIVLRIPVDEWPAFQKQIEGQGNILNHHVSGQDVTEEYVDNEARLRNLKTHEERILELYEEAENIEDMLKIEEELARIRSSIEQLEGRQKYLDQVTSTIKVSLELLEVEEHEFVSGQSEQSLWNEAWLGFKDSLQFIGYLAQRSLVYLTILFPYLILIMIPVIIAFFIRRNRMQAKKKEQE